MVVTERTSQSQYNLNEATIMLIADLQRDGVRFSKFYRINSSFDCWQSIRLLIQARFSTRQQERLDTLEKEFMAPIKKANPIIYSSEQSLLEDERKKKIKRYTNLIMKERLNRYIRFLMILMREYSIGLTDREIKTRLS